MKSDEYVTASEIGDFVYCKRAWWLRRHGLLGTNQAMIAGAQAHTSLFRNLNLLTLKKWFAVISLITGIAVAIAAYIYR